MRKSLLQYILQQIFLAEVWSGITDVPRGGWGGLSGGECRYLSHATMWSCFVPQHDGIIVGFRVQPDPACLSFLVLSNSAAICQANVSVPTHRAGHGGAVLLGSRASALLLLSERVQGVLLYLTQSIPLHPGMTADRGKPSSSGRQVCTVVRSTVHHECKCISCTQEQPKYSPGICTDLLSHVVCLNTSLQ